jgi:signal transduction histidine kinase
MEHTTAANDTVTAGPTDVGRAQRRQALVDVVIAGLYAGLFLGVSFMRLAGVPLLGGEAPGLPWLEGEPGGSFSVSTRLELVSYTSVGLMLASAVALAFRRLRPRASFLAIGGIAGIQVLLGEPIAAWNVVMPASLFSAAAYGSRAFGWLALALATLGYVGAWALVTGILGRLDLLSDPVALLGSPRGLAWAATFAALLAALLVVWAIGDQVRATRERLEIDRDRALMAARERDSNARLDALAERHRIARELHDVVAHGLSVMIIQADGALYAADEHPEAPRQALGVIAATGRESLGEMRRLLGVLRGAGETAETAPQPGLGAIPQLVAGFREAGLEVELALPDQLPSVPPGVALAAYRIVQESLTNVLKHAGRAETVVTVTAEPRQLVVRVGNGPGERRPANDPDAGLGLTGMRERVRLLGGRLSAGPRADGGWEVTANVPFVAVSEPEPVAASDSATDESGAAG